jgi:hypothetical protein
VGDSDIKLAWTSPEKVEHGFAFKTNAGKHITIDSFAWTRPEVSTSQNLVLPDIMFKGDIFWPCFPGSCFVHGTLPVPSPNLVPGTNRQVVKSLTETSHAKCTASTQYTITYSLRWYAFL